MPAFLLPLLMAAGGAGLGAMTNKKNRLKGALMGAGLGALGGAGLGAMGAGAAATGAGATGSSILNGTGSMLSTAGLGGGGVSAAHSANMAAGMFNPATASKWSKGLAAMKKLSPYASKGAGMFGGQEDRSLYMPTPFVPTDSQPIPVPGGIEQGNYLRPMAPQIQSSFNPMMRGQYYG